VRHRFLASLSALAVGIAIASLAPVSVAGQDPSAGTQDRHPGDARHVTQHFGQLNVHELEGFLHVEDVGGAMLDELCAMSEEGPEDAHFIVRSERPFQEPQGMKLLQPLGVVVVRLPARHDFEVARIDQEDADGRPSALEDESSENPRWGRRRTVVGAARLLGI
jgi:hypothetical protein